MILKQSVLAKNRTFEDARACKDAFCKKLVDIKGSIWPVKWTNKLRGLRDNIDQPDIGKCVVYSNSISGTGCILHSFSINSATGEKDFLILIS